MRACFLFRLKFNLKLCTWKNNYVAPLFFYYIAKMNPFGFHQFPPLLSVACYYNIWSFSSILSHGYLASSLGEPIVRGSLSWVFSWISIFTHDSFERLSLHDCPLVDLLIPHDSPHDRLSPHGCLLVNLLSSLTILLVRGFPSLWLFLDFTLWVFFLRVEIACISLLMSI